MVASERRRGEGKRGRQHEVRGTQTWGQAGVGQGPRLGATDQILQWVQSPQTSPQATRISGPQADNHGRPEGNWMSDAAPGRLGVCAFCVLSPRGPQSLTQNISLPTASPGSCPDHTPLSVLPISPHTHSQRAFFPGLAMLVPSKIQTPWCPQIQGVSGC